MNRLDEIRNGIVERVEVHAGVPGRVLIHLAAAANLDRLAAIMQAKWQIGLKGGLVIANPIPAAQEISAGEIAPAIEQALADAAARGIAGKSVTPFLLASIAEATEGRSLSANIALVENNARVAAEIAIAYGRLP